MKRGSLLYSVLFLSVLSVCSAFLCGNEPVRVICDTDLGNDIDDPLALAILYAGAARGECQLLAITLSTSSPKAVPYLRMLNNWYGYENLPIGTPNSTVTPRGAAYLDDVCREGATYLSWDNSSPPCAVEVYRRLLAASPDHSVVIVVLGFATNLAHLLDSPADAISPLTGEELAQAKVQRVVMMGGAFTSEYKEHAEFNLLGDLPASQKLVEQWRGEIVFSGFEVGLQVPFPAQSLAQDYAYAAWHPVVASYRSFSGTNDADVWDTTCILWTLFPEKNYFQLSPPGKVTVRDDGTCYFTPSHKGNHRYFLLQTQEQRRRTEEAYRWLCSQPPKTMK